MTAALREKISLGSRILAKLGLVDYLGHVSARVPGTERVLIRARGAEQGNQPHMTPADVALVDLEARHVDGPHAPDETRMHTEIYKARPDVAAVLHTHQEIVTVFGDLERPVLAVGGVGANLPFEPFPVYPSARKIATAEQGADLARVLGNAPFVHLRNHGLTLVGESVEEVVLHAIWLEHHAKMTMWASLIGKPRGMSRDEAMLKAKERFADDARWRYYASLVGG
jgi:L-ribulose-5-phosphate 4-epimerase